MLLSNLLKIISQSITITRFIIFLNHCSPCGGPILAGSLSIMKNGAQICLIKRSKSEVESVGGALKLPLSGTRAIAWILFCLVTGLVWALDFLACSLPLEAILKRCHQN